MEARKLFENEARRVSPWDTFKFCSVLADLDEDWVIELICDLSGNTILRNWIEGVMESGTFGWIVYTIVLNSMNPPS